MNEYREMRREVDRGCLKIFLLGFLGVAMMLAVGIVVWLGIIVWLFSGLEDIDLSYLVEQTDESEARKSSKIGDAAKPLTDIPQIEPPFLDIAPAGMLPTIISHSKGVKCVLIRSNSSFHGPTTVLPSVKSPNRLSTTKSLPWEALLPCTTR